MTLKEVDSDFAKDRLALRNLPKILTIEDITSRALHQSPLAFAPKHESRQFGSIITPYLLKDKKIKCGIKGCGSPHFRGYLIVTSDGLETNIGKDCGADHLGADFKEQIKRYDRLFELRLKIDRIVSLKDRAPELLERLNELKSAYDPLREKRSRFRSEISRGDNGRLDNRLRENDSGVYEYRPYSQSEVDAYFVANPKARRGGAIPEHKIKTGEIKGLQFMKHSTASEEAISMLGPLYQIVGSTEDEIYLWRDGTIHDTHKWMNNAEIKMDALAEHIKQGQTLFSPDNLENLRKSSIDPPAKLFN